MNIKHGCSSGIDGRTSTYDIWRSMKARCLRPSHKAYPQYGGRGISVCPQWLNNFDVFLADMGPRPDKLDLDRKDNNGNYTPDNCRWVTRTINNRNKRSNRNQTPVTINGETKPLLTWCETFNIKYATVKRRITILNWPEERWFEPTRKLS